VAIPHPRNASYRSERNSPSTAHKMLLPNTPNAPYTLLRLTEFDILILVSSTGKESYYYYCWSCYSIRTFGIMKSRMEECEPPTRASTRIKERRHRHDQRRCEEGRSVPSSSSPSSSSSSTVHAKEQREKEMDRPVESPTKKKKKDTPRQRTFATAKAREDPTHSPLPVARKSPSPRTPVKKDPVPHCQEPPYPFYLSTETPSFKKGMESIVQVLRSCRNIAVLTGAGISVSCGIPDFRSKDMGLYSVLDCEELGLSCPEELFDWEFFQQNPQPFFKFAKKLYFPLENNQKVRPSDSHKLLRLLQDRKQLLRVYSQNIDGLEEEAGVLTKKIVYAHGSLKWATCLSCKRKVPANELEESILEETIPYCQVALPMKKAHVNSTVDGAVNTPPSKPVVRREPSSRQRKRPRPLGNEDEYDSHIPPSRQSSTGSSSDSNICGGILKPNVTFFGQVLPDNVSRCLEADRKKVDALIVIGTSLSVAPISKVIGYLPANIPRILINRTIVHPRFHNNDNGDKEKEEEDHINEPDFRKNYVFDAYLLGNCDDVTRALVRELRVDDTKDNLLPKSLHGLVEMGRLLSEVRAAHRKVVESDIDGDGDEEEGEDDDDDDEVLYRVEDWETAKVPAERVFLFPGAQPPRPSMEDSPVQLQEVCHCNACSKRICKGHIHKCLECFDYDLCGICFPKVFPNHHDGQHTFGIEAVAPVR